MKCFVLAVCCVGLALALPQGYNYKEPGSGPGSGPGIGDSNLGGFKPILNGAPCNHGPNAAALVSQQSIGRIINKQPAPQEVFIAGTGGDQAVTVNSHIVVGDGGQSQSFREGHGYVSQNKLPPAPIPLAQGPPLPPLGSAQSFVHTAQQSFGSNQNSFASSSNSFNGGAIINGIGKVPPPPQALSGGYQYASGFGGAKYSGGGGFGGPIRGPVFSGAPINPNFIAGPRPIGGGGQKFGGIGFQGSSSKFQNIGGFGAIGGGAQLHGSGGQFQSNGAGFSQQHSGGGFISSGSGSQSIGIGSLGQSNNFGGNAILNGALGNVIRETFANAPLDPTVEKHIYVHVPPEDLEENDARQQIRLPEVPAKKHYKIIFIKAPTVNQQTNYAQIANAAGHSEEKTIVYVLVKKPDEPSLGEIQQIQQNIKPSKPEVYFIKYKTKKEELPSGGGGGFIGGGYNANLDQGAGQQVGQQIDSIGGGNFAGSDLDGGLDIRLNGAANAVDSYQSSGSFSSSSSSGSNLSVNIGETNAPHAVYGVPNVKK